MNALLSIDGLCVGNRDTKILHDISLKVYSNEIFAVLGTNGSGKTSLAATVMGLSGYNVASGKIVYKGEDITGTGLTERARRGIALSFQEMVRFEGISVRDYLGLALGEKEDEHYIRYLDICGLSEAYLKRYMDDSLSGGERKRLELACVFASRPDLMILDEPDSGIDIHGFRQIKDAIKDRKKDATVILITHEQELAEISDRAAILCRGYLERIGPPEEVIRYFGERCTACPRIGDQS